MREITIKFDQNLSNTELCNEVAALKVAVALLVEKLPMDRNPRGILEALKSTGNRRAIELAELIDPFLSETERSDSIQRILRDMASD